MKVLVVGTGGALRGSGITTMTDQLESSLADMGHEVERAVAGGSRRRRPNRVNLENLRAILEDVRLVWRAARRAQSDVVWIHTIGVPTMPALRALALTVAARSSGPVVVQFHAFDLAARLRTGGRVQRRVIGLIERMATALVVLHEADSTALRDVVGPEKVVVLPNWVDVGPATEELGPIPPLRVVFVGGLIQRKGLPQLLDAVRLLRGHPVRLRVVGGPGDEGPEVAASYRDSASDLVRDGLVEFVGELDSEGVRAALRASHVLVLPSQAEGTPRSLLEALSEGRMAVVTDVGDMGDLVRAGSCGVVLADGSARQIADTLGSLALDEPRVRELALNAHRFAMKALSSESRGAAIESILERAC